METHSFLIVPFKQFHFIIPIQRITLPPPAQVVKLVDTLCSGRSARKGMGVRVSPWAPPFKIKDLQTQDLRTKSIFILIHLTWSCH